MANQRQPMSDDDLLSILRRLQAKSRPDESGCLLWCGTLRKEGYAHIRVGKRMMLVHRLAWEAARGPIPDGLFVCHHCDVPNCLNVDHLFLGTQADNMADMARKGRSNVAPAHAALMARGKSPTEEAQAARKANGYANVPRGSKNVSAKLTEDIVVAIRASEETQQTIADRYGVSRGLIGHIKRGIVWRHVHV